MPMEFIPNLEKGENPKEEKPTLKPTFGLLKFLKEDLFVLLLVTFVYEFILASLPK
ncbi:MAG: hypothetical protein ACJASP_001637 [Roseivirga sp.]|jgi:hypothetical protein